MPPSLAPPAPLLPTLPALSALPPWLAALAGGSAGVALQLQQPQLWPLWAYAGVAAAACVLAALLWRAARPAAVPAPWQAAVWALVAAALLFASTGARALWIAADALAPELEGRDLLLTGYVAGLPQRGDSGWQFEFHVHSASLDGRSVQVPQRLRLGWFEARAGRAGAANTAAAASAAALPALYPGQRWQLTARLERPHGLANPHGFDWELRLWEQRIRATGSVRQARGVAAPQRLAHGWAYPVQQARHWVRARMFERVEPASSAGLLAALVVGDQGAVDPEHWETFRLTGVTHLMVVSGTHITLFAWLAMAGLALLWRALGQRAPTLLLHLPTPTAAALGGLALGFAYALFAGWGVPAQRAVLMLAILVLLQLSGRRWPWPATWLAVLLGVLLLDPWAMLSAGFWLSFMAVAVLFATGLPLPVGGRSLRHYVWGLVRTQALITLALAPMLLLWFGEFSLVGLLANLPAIPWVTLLVTPLALAGVIFWPLWLLAAWMLELLLLLLQTLQHWPWASISRPALPMALAVLAVLGGWLLVLQWPWALRLWGLLLLWPALAFSPARPALGEFEWLAADIGQGTAVVVRTRHHTLIYDTGPPMGPRNDAARRVLLPLLRRHGEAPTKVLISHDDNDHASGIETLAAAYPQARWLASFETQHRGVTSERCVAGQQWVWDGVPFRILHPQAADYAQPARSDNAMSCVLLVGEGAHSLLLPGDITTDEETRLALAQPQLRAGVLFAAHHGSRTSTGPVWLNRLQPQLVVIQAAHRSRYGHPHPEVLARLQARAIPWVTTAQCGAAWGQGSQPGAVTCQRLQRARYWQHPDRRGPGSTNQP